MTSQTEEILLEAADFLLILAREYGLGHREDGVAMEVTPRMVAMKVQIQAILKDRAPKQAALSEIRKRRRLLSTYPSSPAMDRMIEKFDLVIKEILGK